MNLLKSFSVYTIASFIERGIAFLLLPVFTFYLTTKDFGILALITSVISFVLPLVTLGIQGAISVAYFKGDRNNYSSYFTSSFFPPLVISFFLTILVLLFKNPIEVYLDVPILWVLFIPMFCFFSFLNSMLLTDYQIKNEPIKYITYSLSSSTLNIVLSLFFVVLFDFGFEGRLLAQYLSVFIFSLVAVHILYRKRKLLVKNISWINVKDSLLFGLPLIPHILGSLVINMSDRLFVDYYYGKEALGIYNIGYVLGSAISILCGAFANAITPFSYELFSKNTYDAKVKVTKMYWLFIGLMILIVFLIYICTPFVFKWFIDIKFLKGAKYVFWIALGYFFQGLYLLFANLIFYLKKTKVLFYLSFLNIVINLGLNYILIPSLGPIGAAYATCISFFIFFITIAIYSNKIYPLPWMCIFIKKQ